MRLFAPTAMNVRAMAVGLTVLAHLLVLLLLRIQPDIHGREAAQELPQFISIWPDSLTLTVAVQPPPATPLRPLAAQSRSAPRAITLAAAPQEPAAPEPAAGHPIDWVTEGQKAATRSAANSGNANTFSPPPNTNLPARLCAPRKISEAMQAKMDALLPPPIDLSPAPSGPADSVMMPGGIRVGIMKFRVPMRRRAARQVSREDLHKRPESSVPDPNTCD